MKPTPSLEPMPAEPSQQPDESLKPYRLQLTNGSGRVVWQQFLPFPRHLMGLDVTAFWNDGRSQVYSTRRDDWVTSTLPGSF